MERSPATAGPGGRTLEDFFHLMIVISIQTTNLLGLLGALPGHWGEIAFICAASLWAVQLLIVRRLAAKGYRYSEVFGSRLYIEYWRSAHSQGWSRLPLFVLPILLLVLLLAFLSVAIH